MFLLHGITLTSMRVFVTAATRKLGRIMKPSKRAESYQSAFRAKVEQEQSSMSKDIDAQLHER